MDDKDRGIKAVPFSGKKDDYTIWRPRFLRYAQVKGCKAALVGKEGKDVEIPAYDEVLTAGDDADDIKIKLRKANDKAYSMLTMSVKDPVSFGVVHNAITNKQPDGYAAQALKNLDTIFKIKSMATKHDLEQQFNNNRLVKDDKNPNEWFAELDKIQLLLQMDYKEP
jgi:hypothetical protein